MEITQKCINSPNEGRHVLLSLVENGNTVNSPNCGHFSIQASVLYSESMLYSGVKVKSSPIHVVITVMILKHLELFRGYHACLLNIS